MIECKFCGYTSNEGEFKFCPKCGKDLSTSPQDVKSKKQKKAEKKAEKVVKTETSMEKKKKIVVIDPFKKRKVRASYVLFGLCALILALGGLWLYGDLFLGGTIGTKWAVDFADKYNGWVSFGGIREKALEFVPFSNVEAVLVDKNYHFVLAISGIAFLLVLFSLFTGKQNTGSIFLKFSELFSVLGVFLYFGIAALEGFGLLDKVAVLQKIADFYNDKQWIFWAVCAGLGAFDFIIGLLCSFSRKNVYRTTFYQFWKALFWLAICLTYALPVIEKITIPVKIVEICLEWNIRLLYAIPVHLLLCALFMFACSRHSKKASQMMK